MPRRQNFPPIPTMAYNGLERFQRAMARVVTTTLPVAATLPEAIAGDTAVLQPSTAWSRNLFETMSSLDLPVPSDAPLNSQIPALRAYVTAGRLRHGPCQGEVCRLTSRRLLCLTPLLGRLVAESRDFS